MDADKIYNAYRLKALGENDLINQRMTWFVVLQSFLFISSAIVSNAEPVKDMLAYVHMGVASVGLCSAVLAFYSIRSALNAIRATKKSWEDEFVKPNHLTNEFRVYPALTGGTIGDELSARGRLLPKALPTVVGLFWLLVLAYSVSQVF